MPWRNIPKALQKWREMTCGPLTDPADVRGTALSRPAEPDLLFLWLELQRPASAWREKLENLRLCQLQPRVSERASAWQQSRFGAMDSAAETLLRIHKRGDGPSSVARYVRSLPAGTQAAVLGSLSAGPSAPALLRALWAARALHPGVLTAVAVAAAALLPPRADSLLTEAEALLCADARHPEVPARSLTAAATALLPLVAGPARSAARHAARLVVATARALRIAREPRAADHVLQALLRRAVGADALLAMLAHNAPRLSPKLAAALRSAVISFAKDTHGQEAQDVPALLKVSLARIAGRDGLDWARVVVSAVREVAPHVFADVVSVLECQLSDSAAASGTVLNACEAGFSDGWTLRDLVTLVAVYRSTDSLSVHSRVLRACAVVLVNCQKSAQVGSQTRVASKFPGDRRCRSTGDQVVCRDVSSARLMCLRDLLKLPGMELRCSAFVDVAVRLVREGIVAKAVAGSACMSASERGALGDCCSDFLIAVFVRHEGAREAVLDAAFSALVEDAAPVPVQDAFRRTLASLADHQLAPGMFRSLVPRLRHWFGYLSSVPARVGGALVTMFAPLAVSLPALGDFLTVTLRKLVATRASHAQTIAAAGLVALITNPDLDRETADAAVELTCSLLGSSTLRVRAALLDALAARMANLSESFLQDSRYDPLHAAVLSRIVSIHLHRPPSAGTLRKGETCPLHLDICFEVVCGQPSLREAVPELFQYVALLRSVSKDANLVFVSLVEYIADMDRGLKDVVTPHWTRALNPKWVYAKCRLLITLCEAVLGLGDPCTDREAVFNVYGACLHLRDGLSGKLRLSEVSLAMRLSLPFSACLEILLSGRDISKSGDLLTAREFASLAQSSMCTDGGVCDFGLNSDRCALVMDCARNLGRDDVLFDSNASTSASASSARLPSSIRALQRSSDTFLPVDCLEMLLQETLFRLTEQRMCLVVANELLSALLCAFRLGLKRSGCVPSVSSCSPLVSCVTQFFSNTHPWFEDGLFTEHGVCPGQNRASPSTCGGGIPDSENPSGRRRRLRASSGSTSCCPQGTTSKTSSLTMPAEGGHESSQEVVTASACEHRKALSRVMPTGSARSSACEEDNHRSFSYRNLETLISLCEDCDAREALTRAYRSRTAFDRSRVALRYYALEVLRLVQEVSCCSPEWDRMISNVVPETGADELISDPAGLWRCKRTLRFLLRCFEREFEYSMSTSLAVSYITFLDELLFRRPEERNRSKSDPLERVRDDMCAMSIRILRSFSVTHATVLRAMLSMLLKALKTDDALGFISVVFSRLPRVSGAQNASDSDEDEKRPTRLNPDFDDDILAAGLAMDGVITCDSETNQGLCEASPSASAGVYSYGVRQSFSGNAPKPSHESSCSGSSVESKKKEGPVGRSGGVLSNEAFVMQLSLAETEECRATTLSACLSYIESLTPRHRVGDPRTYSQSGSAQSWSRWEESDASILGRIWSLLGTLLYGEDIVDRSTRSGQADGDVDPRRIPTVVLTKTASVAAALLNIGRTAACFLKAAPYSRGQAGCVETASACNVAATVLKYLSCLRSRSRQCPHVPDPFEVSRVRFLDEKFHVDCVSAVENLRKRKCCPSELATFMSSLERAAPSSAPKRKLTDEDSFPMRKRRPLRSRNRVVDEWLQDERGVDNFADMEDFIVDADVCEGL